MNKRRFSIRSTLFAIIGVLNLLIITQAGYQLYKASITQKEARALFVVSKTVNDLFNVQKNLSLERGTAMALAYATHETAGPLRADLKNYRKDSDNLLKSSFRVFGEDDPRLVQAIETVKESYLALRQVRRRIDTLTPEMHTRRDAVATQIFDATTRVVTDIHKLIDVYSRPYLPINGTIARQIRFSTVVWNISEYAGREYAVLGRLIAENAVIDPDLREKLAVWRGRVQYGWELAYSNVQSTEWGGQMRPVMEEAETHYFMTFDQIKEMFYNVHPGSSFRYPITEEMWLELASQAVDSLHEMGDTVLRVNQLYVERLQNDAQRAILFSILIFLSTLWLNFYSWRVISLRVIRPVNTMVETLYKATEGENYRLQRGISNEDEIGKLATVLAVFQENSAQLEMERDRAQAANKAKSEFLANMSHEIRTPMNVVLGLANILAKSSPLTEKQLEYIKTLHLSAESLLTIINDLLDFSKIETRNFSLENIPFSLHNLLHDLKKQLTVSAQDKNIALEVEFSCIRDRFFMGDPTRVRQILVNLCGNAIKFTETGTVRIMVHCPPFALNQENDIVISVEDTGIGIAPENLDTIFDKFTQADSSITRKYGGTGLGLAISKTFAEMMGGDIGVTSVVGKGTTFTVRLPLVLTERPDDHPSDMGETNEMQSEKGNVTALIVEDYQPNVLVARTYLEHFGMQADVAENGHKALEKVKEKIYDFILMDVQMQGMDGYEATKAIRLFERGAGRRPTRIIGMTAHALVGDREKCLQAGMDEYISKPFNPDKLKEIMEALA